MAWHSPAGAEFFQRRLARCAALPPAERPAEASAFLESVGHVRDLGLLLPLEHNAPDGEKVVLPQDAAAAERALLAFCENGASRLPVP